MGTPPLGESSVGTPCGGYIPECIFIEDFEVHSKIYNARKVVLIRIGFTIISYYLLASI
jgi:hypothetical protein